MECLSPPVLRTANLSPAFKNKAAAEKQELGLSLASVEWVDCAH